MDRSETQLQRVYDARSAKAGPGVQKLWRYRELILFLAWREILSRYKQTVIGLAWAVLRPIIMVGIFTLIFGVFADLPSHGVPYPAYVLCAWLPWQLFSQCLNGLTSSVVANQAMIQKVYFPRVILPITAVCSALVDFLIAWLVFMAVLFYYDINPGWSLLLLPFLALYTVLIAFSVGIWFAALSVKYRDFRHIVPFLTQVWLYLTPVAYSSSIVPDAYRFLFGLNPMTGAVELFRWGFLGQTLHVGPEMGISAGFMLLMLMAGMLYFRRAERLFADVI